VTQVSDVTVILAFFRPEHELSLDTFIEKMRPTFHVHFASGALDVFFWLA